MARYLFSTITAAACLAMVAGPNVCFAADGADSSGGGKAPAKAKAGEPKPAKAAQTAAQNGADSSGGASEASPASVAGGEGADSLAGGAGADTITAAEAPSLAEPASLGFANLTHPGGATSASHDGQSYEANAEGVMTVPLAAVDALTSHGFVLS